MISRKKILAILVLTTFGVGMVFLWKSFSGGSIPVKSESSVSEASSFVTEPEVAPVATETSDDGSVSVGEGGFPLCENSDEVATFEKPIPIVWEAKFGGCIQSCYGAYFTRVEKNAKYSRFSGYPVGNEKMIIEMLDAGLIDQESVLRITGKWVSIDDGYSSTLFNGKCVPTVDIERIEALGK